MLVHFPGSKLINYRRRPRDREAVLFLVLDDKASEQRRLRSKCKWFQDTFVRPSYDSTTTASPFGQTPVLFTKTPNRQPRRVPHFSAMKARMPASAISRHTPSKYLCRYSRA